MVMASIRRGLRALLALAAVFVGSAALAQSFDHRVYLDLDNNPATGCSVTTAAGAVNGAELRLTATVTGLPPTVTSATRETCSAGSFGSPQAQASGYPVGLGNGSGGADVVEFSTLLDGLGASGTARLIFVSSSATGADLASGTLALPGLAVASQPAVIPSTGLLALILLAGVVFWLARKHPGFGTSVAVLLLLGAGVVWAANFIVDGQVADWTGVSPLSADAGNDASSGEPQIELVQVFAATEAGRLFARADLSDTQSAAPVFNSAATATFTTGSPGTFSVTAAGIPTPTLSLSGGTLPTGVGFNAATGVLSGTPTAGTGGSYPLQFSATNSQGTTTQNFNLVVNQAPVVTSATATTFIAGAPGSFTVTASGFPAPTFALTGTLPSGITLDPGSGVLSGTASSGSGGSYPRDDHGNQRGRQQCTAELYPDDQRWTGLHQRGEHHVLGGQRRQLYRRGERHADANPESEQRHLADGGELRRCHWRAEWHACPWHGRCLCAGVQRHQCPGHDHPGLHPEHQ
jgi:hypothetical protein